MSDLRARLRIDGDAKGAVAAAQSTERALEGVGAKGRTAQGGLTNAAAGADRFERSATGARTAAMGLASAFAALGLRELAGHLSDSALQAQGFTTGLSAVAGGAQGAAAETAFLRKESERLGLVVQNQVEGFMSLAGATNGTVLAGEATREIWLGLAEAGTALNRSTEQQKRALEAVSQIASKGVVSMEEVRGQLAEAIPGATQIAARAMGMTSEAFIELVSSGDLLARDFLPRFAQQLRSEFGEAVQAQMITPLGLARREMAATKSALFDLSAAGGEGFLTGMTEGLAAFNAEIQDPETLAAARELGQTLGEAFGTAAEAAAFLVEHIDMVVAAGGALTTIALARYLAGVAAGATQAAVAFRAKALAEQAAAAAALAEVQAEIRNTAAMVATTAQADRLAAAKLRLAAATRAATPAMLGMNAAATGLIGLLGGPWGIAFTAAAGAAALLSVKLQESDKRAADLEAGLDLVEVMAQETADSAGILSGGLDDLAEASRRAEIAARNHASAETDRRKEMLATALVEARSRLADAQTRASDRSYNAWRYAEGGDGGVGFAESQTAAAQEVQQRQAQVDLLYQSYLELAVEGSGQGRRGGSGTPQGDGFRGGASAPASPAATADTEHDNRAARAAERRLERAREIAAQLKVETKLLEERSVAAAQGEAALEALAVKEAGLRVLMDLGVTSLGELSGAQREAAAAAIAAAEAHERQAIATDKAQRVAGAVQDLDRRIAAERARTEAIEGGIKATLAWQKEEFVRQELERHGTTLTAEQIALLREKAEALYEERVAGDLAAANEERQRELNLLRMTGREREIERRARDILLRQQIEMNGLTEEEAKIRARILAGRELEEEESAQAIGRLKEDLRAAFIESGEIGFDKIADYAERRLREAVYDALLAKPIDVVINAIVGNITGQGGLTDALGQMLGRQGGAGGSGMLASMSAAAAQYAAPIAMMAVVQKLSAQGAGSLTKLFGGDAAQVRTAEKTGGWLGSLPGFIAGMFDNGSRPYARADIGVRDGQFVVTGGQALDDGPLQQMTQAAEAIAQRLNAAADLFKLDLTAFTGPTAIGYVEGKNTGRLGQGFFGGDGGGFNTGAQFSGYEDPEQLAEEIVRATILRAIEAGAADLSEAETRIVQTAKSLDEAAAKISAGRSITESIEDAILQLTNPAEFERKQALAAIEASYQALKAQAQELITAGLVSGDVLTKIDQLRDLQVEDALERLGEAADSASEALERAAGLRTSIEDRILELTNPQGFKVKRGEDEIAEMRAEVEALIAQGAMAPDVLQQLELLRQLELANVFGELKSAADETAEAFARMAPRLQQWIDQLAVSDFAELSPQAERAEALRQYEEALRAARMGDTEALGNLTAYADRLLSADREATLSAQDRLALVNRVRGEVGGLVDYTAPSSAAAPATIAGMGELQALLSQISANTALAVMNPANDDTSAAAPVLVVNLPALGQLYADTASQQTDRHLAALVELRSAIVAVLDRHHGALTEDLKALRAAAAALPAVIDERLGATEAAMSGVALSLADLTTETRLSNAYLKTAVAR